MNNNEQHINIISQIVKGEGAFLGAAVGDALGWPQEPEAKKINKKHFLPTEILNDGFQEWTRRSGGQYFSHQEIILAGEYSDDTQLILCTARSLLYGERWWHHFTRRELPTWTSYERGGGGATKRAARQWLAGIEPWSSLLDKDKKKYFDAGGNGVAMRILPHCVLAINETSFEKIAKNIIANGITTHGHPRALVGALAYCFALWIALREVNTLQYGGIIEKVLSEVNCWSTLQDLSDIFPTWKSAALQITDGQYDETWKSTIGEMLRLLKICQAGMKQGAISIEREILTTIGCFDKNVKGAGTVSAAAAIFLASRFAANPFHGLLEAGFAHNADTDTIASMTGGILGAIAGTEWLGNYAIQVQDSKYIRNIAENLTRYSNDSQTKQEDNTTVRNNNLDSFIKQIEVSKTLDNIFIPYGINAQVKTCIKHISMSKSTVTSWKLITNDGQSLYIKKYSRIKNNTDINPLSIFTTKFENNLELQHVNVLCMGVEIPVVDMDKSRFFYEKVLGISVDKESKTLVRCGSIVLIRRVDYRNKRGFLPDRDESITNNVIDIEVASIDEAYNNVKKVEAKIVQDISKNTGRRYFYCLDPDNNFIRIYEVEF